ncbi:MAG: hypothetical protein R6U69_06590 [Marinobacter sp.]|uniref:hypothetical protein n=1 Tax=Marinobacter sp. TaxID=50741 RepID=UPI0035632A4D
MNADAGWDHRRGRWRHRVVAHGANDVADAVDPLAAGGVFGIGFLREHLKITYRQKIDEIQAHQAAEDREEVKRLL